MQSGESWASPIPQSPLTRFREYLGQDRLAYQYDAEAGRAVFYPRVAGPGTGNCELDWRVSGGVGTVYAVTVVAPQGEPAYNVVYVDMDEGFRLMSRVQAGLVYPALGGYPAATSR